MTEPEEHNPDETRLRDLFRAYREATEFSDTSADFMPCLWRRIESRRRNSLRIARLARAFATATVALAVIAGIVVSEAANRRPQEESWVEALANDHFARNASYYEPVHLSSAVEKIPAPVDSPEGHN